MQTFSDIVRDINGGNIAPTYLLDGDEPYYIDRILEQLEQTVPEEEKDFNLITFYGKETDIRDVINALRQFPMFGKRIMVILREAAHIKTLSELTDYLTSPQPTSVLVIEHRFKKIDGRSKLPKLVQNKGVYFTSSKIKEYQIPEWITSYCQQHDSTIGHAESEMLAAYLGTDLQKIANELTKLWVNKDEGREVTAEKIEKYIGINRDYNPIELPSVLFEQNMVRLAGMLNYFASNPKAAPMPALIGIFCAFIQKVYVAQVVPKNFTKDKQLGIWSMHRKVAQRYPPIKIHHAIMLLEEFSHKAVGIGSANKDDLLREMIGKMLVVLQ